MALVKRLSRLFAADMHAVLDQLEEPEAVLKQAIREMEEELARQEQRAKWLEKESDAAAARMAALEEAKADFDNKLDTCFEHGNDALARKLTRRKLECQKLAEGFAAKRSALHDQLSDIAATITANRGQLDSLQQKAELLAADRCIPRWERGDATLGGIDDDEVEIAFLREKQRRTAS